MTSGYRGNSAGSQILTPGQIQDGAVDYPKLSATAQAALLAGGHRNLLINPQWVINQRAYASGAATGAANQYIYDRWRVVTAGQSATLSAGVLTAPTGGVEQVIEGLNVFGGAHVLSWVGSATATINGVAAPNGGTVNLPSGTNAIVRFSGGTVQYPQLERGTQKTSFDQRPYIIERLLCLRYYEVVVFQQALAVVYAGGFAGSPVHWFTVQKRVPPSSVISQLSATGLTNINFVGNAYPNTESCGFVFTTTSPVGTAGILVYTATFGAEL